MPVVQRRPRPAIIECSSCGTPHPSEYYPFQVKQCRECKTKRAKIYYKSRGQGYIRELGRAYNKTFKGLMVRCYRNMKSRVVGVQKQKFHLYGGLELLSKDDFYQWTRTDPAYKKLFKAWVRSGYTRRPATPSIDRIDTSRGYVLDNMQWITLSENSRKGACSENR